MYGLYRLIYLSTYRAERVSIDRKEKSEADMMERQLVPIKALRCDQRAQPQPDPSLISSIDYPTEIS